MLQWHRVVGALRLVFFSRLVGEEIPLPLPLRHRHRQSPLQRCHRKSIATCCCAVVASFLGVGVR